MSRHAKTSIDGKYSYAIGYDYCVHPDVDGGFFIQIYDVSMIGVWSELHKNDEGIIINEGYVKGLPQDEFYAKMDKYAQQYNFINEWAGTAAKQN